MQPIYETNRLLLKALNPTDTDIVLGYYMRNRPFLEEWEPIRNEEFYTAPFQQELLRREQTDLTAGASLRLWIFKKEDDTRTIGCVAFNNIVRGAFLSCHLGYKLDQQEINHGYMTEAIQKGIEIIFGEYGLHRIEANIMPRNGRSLRVVEKLGFYHEGLARNYLKINGKWEDHIHMVLLNDKV